MRRQALKRWLRAGFLTPALIAGCSSGGSYSCSSCSQGVAVVPTAPAQTAMYVYLDPSQSGTTPQSITEANKLAVVSTPPRRVLTAPRTLDLTTSETGTRLAAAPQPTTPTTTVAAKPSVPTKPDLPPVQDDVKVQPATHVEPPKPAPIAKASIPVTKSEDLLPPADVPLTPPNVPNQVDAPPPKVDASQTTFGHGDDYGWLCGEVQYSRLSKGWRLRYATLDDTDAHGGSVTLMDDSILDNLKDGQMVRVQGRIVNPEGKAIAPPYRVDALQVIEK